jgi:hypothetical protein
MFGTGELVGDVQGNPVYSNSALLLATTLVVVSYVVMLGPVFNFACKLKVRPINFGAGDEKVPNRLGLIILALQLGFMTFNLVTGVNVAGANTVRSESSFALFWVFIPVDALFFVFYGFYRDSKYFYINLAVWLISNVLRGWSGIFMFVLFFEWCRGIRSNRISLKKAIAIGAGAIVLFPVLTALKWALRAQATNVVSLGDIVEGLSANLGADDFLIIVWQGIIQVFARLQVTSLVVEVIRLAHLLQNEFSNNSFTPFWLEGLHGIIYEKLFVGHKSLPLSVAFSLYGSVGWQSAVVGDWNINTGLVSWFFVAPILAPFFVLYVVSLGLSSVFLAKKMGNFESSKDMVWFAWLVYLMPPWFPAFITVLQALLIMLFLRFLLSRKSYV